MRAKYVYLRLENLLLMRIYAIDTPRETTTMPNFCALSALCALRCLWGTVLWRPVIACYAPRRVIHWREGGGEIDPYVRWPRAHG